MAERSHRLASRWPLTAIDQPIAATASKAVEMIIAAQKGEPSPKILTVISATIVERGSVASCSPRADG